MIVQVGLWVCDECDYFRIEKKTGVHVAPNPDNPRGPYLRHELKPVRFQRGRDEVTDAQVDLYRRERF